MKKMILLSFLFSASAFANSPTNLVNCGDFLSVTKIRSCTELLPAKFCRNTPGNLIKRGQLWMNETQSTSAQDVYVIDGATCLDVLTEFAPKTACCGG